MTTPRPLYTRDPFLQPPTQTHTRLRLLTPARRLEGGGRAKPERRPRGSGSRPRGVDPDPRRASPPEPGRPAWPGTHAPPPPPISGAQGRGRSARRRRLGRRAGTGGGPTATQRGPPSVDTGPGPRGSQCGVPRRARAACRWRSLVGGLPLAARPAALRAHRLRRWGGDPSPPIPPGRWCPG